MNFYPHTIVENFYENPDAIRKFALAQEYKFCHEQNEISHVYPGCRTRELCDLNKALYDKICSKLISVFHIPNHDRMRWEIRTGFQSVSAKYGQGVIHTDGDTIFAGVLYLTPDAQLNSGTSLFKKNQSFNQDNYKRALDENDAKFRTGDIRMSTEYHSMFDEVARFSNLYNTLVIYEGDNFHAANNFFGESLDDSRLTQAFFIKKIDANKADSFPINRIKSVKV
ncbi:DUF6445 family protein [Methylotenera sp.]|uniref:DUF6445 family protein n=1 Tax=Methylotenera sp. TaxID=2051956 RepID=UPI002486E247|nr:DUF6445 family protein [Methylotenera sp.]MDI1360814.1 DUF6445 family protein [Methylotenera sp.]